MTMLKPYWKENKILFRFYTAEETVVAKWMEERKVNPSRSRNRPLYLVIHDGPHAQYANVNVVFSFAHV